MVNMSSEPQLFKVEPEKLAAERIEEVEFSSLGFQERRDIQEWVAANPGILGDDLLIVGKEFNGFDRTNERLDLLAVDTEGKLVIIELKRDDTGTDAHWQAVKYASYLHRASAETIVRMLAAYKEISQEDAETSLLRHLDSDDLNALNNDQRIILASHRFAPEVTSAALWLNEKAGENNLISCIRLTPHRDVQADSLYIQATTIIPVPGIEDYVVEVGSSARNTGSSVRSTFAENLKATYDLNRKDSVTFFLRDTVAPLVLDGLAPDIRPDRKGKWAGGPRSGEFRYYHFWYSSMPWGNWTTSYRINLWPQEDDESWQANVEFRHQLGTLDLEFANLNLEQDCQVVSDGIVVDMGVGILDDQFAHRIASATRLLIEHVTPIVDELEDEDNETEA